MDPSPFRARLMLPVAGGLVLLGLVSASRMYFGYQAAGRPISALDALGSGLLEWGLWAPLLPLVLRLARAFRFERGSLVRSFLAHLAGAVLASLAQIFFFGAASAAIREWRFGSGSLPGELAAGFLFKLHTGVVAYWAAVFAFQAWDEARRSREQALRRERQERALAEARLAAVQSQLGPHFLFNALNTISASLREAPDTAERMLARLGDLLRTVLERRDEQEHTLEDELAFLDSYLELQRERFGARLAVELRIDPGARDVCVPTFLLLPLVENAIQHGISKRSGPVALRILAERKEGRLSVAVEDDGPGFEVDQPGLERRGLGLASVRERLRLVHGDWGRCELGRAAAGGAAIRLSFPLAAR